MTHRGEVSSVENASTCSMCWALVMPEFWENHKLWHATLV